MSCVLRASGRDFDVDSFLKGSTLKPLIVHHRGERRFPDSKIQPGVQSGMNVSVSEREFSDLAGQIEDAILFIQKNAEELHRLRDFPGMERIDIDFPIRDRDVAVQCDAFPPKLLSLLGELRIGLVISRYPASENPTQA